MRFKAIDYLIIVLMLILVGCNTGRNTYNNYSGSNNILSIKSKTDTLVFTNLSKDTLYLFSSYLKDDIANSKFLNRIDNSQAVIKKSFLPLTPYLSTSLRDRVIGGENKLIHKGQVLFEFIEIVPRSRLILEINIDMNVDSYCKDFSPKIYNVYDKIKFKKANKKNKNYKEVLEFAIYRDVTKILEDGFFGKNPLEYNHMVKQFLIYQLEI